MKARMTNPIMLVPDAMQAAQALGNAGRKGDVPAKTLELMHLRQPDQWLQPLSGYARAGPAAAWRNG